MKVLSSITALSFIWAVAAQSSSSASSLVSSLSSASASASSSNSNLVSASSTPTSTASAAAASVTDIINSENCPSCANISTTFTNCNVESNLNTTCLCSESIQQTYLQCVECVLLFTGSSNSSVETYQALMNGYRNQCASATVSPTSLPPVTVTVPVSGSSSGSGSSSASMSSSMSSSVSSSAVSTTSSASSSVASNAAASPSASPSGGADRSASALTLLAGAGTVLVCLAAAVGV